MESARLPFGGRSRSTICSSDGEKEDAISNKAKGIIFITLSAFAFACMGALVRLAGDLPSMQKSFFRNAVAFFVALIVVRRQHISCKLDRTDKNALLMRMIAGTVSLVCNYYALDRIPLSDASMLSKMSPFFVIIFSWLLLREKVTKAQWGFIALAIFGSLFALKPNVRGMCSIPALIAFIGGMAAGLAQATLRILGKHGVDRWTIILAFSAFSCAVTLPFFVVLFEPMTWEQVIILLGAGTAATVAQYCLTVAYSYARAVEISIYDYSQIIFSAILGYVLFHQVADLSSIVGYIIIGGAALGMFFYDKRRQASVQAGATQQ